MIDISEKISELRSVVRFNGVRSEKHFCFADHKSGSYLLRFVVRGKKCFLERTPFNGPKRNMGRNPENSIKLVLRMITRTVSQSQVSDVEIPAYYTQFSTSTVEIVTSLPPDSSCFYETTKV
ncbi:CLUMA_CG002021, isoform A [Clunio marinus]|uniref:CLUMA_CG002021, isoform A n=1 Tax=Clunio marinus TaxID=568069 RepID=A0A1J1HJK5_9DIPT|nr:CLUMA_CG002021, isoform A [Clunio marinus]